MTFITIYLSDIFTVEQIQEGYLHLVEVRLAILYVTAYIYSLYCMCGHLRGTWPYPLHVLSVKYFKISALICN
jgi:hypothetical protein